MEPEHASLPVKPADPALLKYLDMYQGIITRMAGNSAACKQWAVALVSAILVLVAKDGKIEFAVLAGIPAVLFCFLDAYYLALEKQFRAAQGDVVAALHERSLYSEHLFMLHTTGKLPKTFLAALTSWAVWPFYLGMLGLVAGAKWLMG